MRAVVLAMLLAVSVPATGRAEPWSVQLEGAGSLSGAWPLPDGSLLVKGHGHNGSGASVTTLVRLDPLHEADWAIQLEGVGPLAHDDRGATCYVDPTVSSVGRIESDGTLAWESGISELTQGASPLADGGCLAYGRSSAGRWLARLDRTGAVTWSRRWDGTDPHDPVGAQGLELVGAAELGSGRIALGLAHATCDADVRVELLDPAGVSLQVAPVAGGPCATQANGLSLAPGGTLVVHSLRFQPHGDRDSCLMDAQWWAVRPDDGWGLESNGVANPWATFGCTYDGHLALAVHGRRTVSLQQFPSLRLPRRVNCGHDEEGARTWAVQEIGFGAVMADGSPLRIDRTEISVHGPLAEPPDACHEPPVPAFDSTGLLVLPWPADGDDDWTRPEAGVLTTPSTRTIAAATVTVHPPCALREPSALDERPDAEPLRVERLASGLALGWEDVGMPEYAVVEGALGSWSDGAHAACGLILPRAIVPEVPGNRWYVATSLRDGAESSRGRSSDGAERSLPLDACP